MAKLFVLFMEPLRTLSLKFRRIGTISWLEGGIALLLLFGLFVRFANLGNRFYWHDEALTSLRSSGIPPDEVYSRLFDGHVITAQTLLQYQCPNPEKGLVDTVKVLATHPEHPPLYFLMARFWMLWFGCSPEVSRSLSAIISILAIPLIYWLSLELFESRRTALVAAALMSVSPFHVLYAQEARQYSLLTVMIILSSVVLLRALRLQTKKCWGVYALTVTLGLYTHLFFVFVAISHGLYTMITGHLRLNRWHPLSKEFQSYLLATLIAFLAFIPWAAIFITKMSNSASNASWTTTQTSLLFLLKRWSINFSSPFIDFYHLHNVTRLVSILFVLVLVGYSLYYLWRKTSKRVWLFIFLLVGITAGVLVLWDLILGGARSTTSRYLLASYVGVQLAVAHLLATRVSANDLWSRRIWRAITVILFAGAALSCMAIVQAENWWNKGNDASYLQIAQTVNQADRPLLVSDDFLSGHILGLGHSLDPDVQLQLLKYEVFSVIDISDHDGDIFWLNPSPLLMQEIAEDNRYQLEMIVPDLLWLLTVQPPILNEHTFLEVTRHDPN